MQTLSTIGYGTLSPNPDEPLINTIVFVATLLGIAASTIVTGVTWAKFSIPENSSIKFSKIALFSTFHGVNSVMFRAGNARSFGSIIETSFRMAVIKSNPQTGVREMVDLELVQMLWPVFQHTATVVHIIDENSPLFGLSEDQMESDNIALIVLFSGLDTTLEENVFKRKTYAFPKLVFSKNAKFQSCVFIQENNLTVVDFSKLSLLEQSSAFV